MSDERKILVRRRLQMAQETLNDALLLQSGGGPCSTRLRLC